MRKSYRRPTLFKWEYRTPEDKVLIEANKAATQAPAVKNGSIRWQILTRLHHSRLPAQAPQT